MPCQSAVTIRAEVEPARLDRLSELLRTVEDGSNGDDLLPFATLSGVHFARLFIVPDAVDLKGGQLPASLMYMSDVDGSVEKHLADLVEKAGHGLDAIFGLCTDYPRRHLGPAARLAWLSAHLVHGATTYVHTIGRTVAQVMSEARLRAAISDFVDGPQAVPPTASRRDVHGRVRVFVHDAAALRWALRPANGPGLRFHIQKALALTGAGVAGLLLAPVVLPVIGVVLLRVRLLERRDVADPVPTPSPHLQRLEEREDFVGQNPFTAVGFVKVGPVRRLVMTSVLAGLNFATRYVYHRDNLAGVRTIHFARWLPIDGGRRMVFASSYDGSVESYMDDFIDRLANGLNAVVSNGHGYPATRWLIRDGARDEGAFKRFLRNRQLPTQVWFSAYPALPARNIDDAAVLRRGLRRPLGKPAATTWCELL